MKNFLGNLLPFLLFVLLLLLLGGISFLVVATVALGSGWLLRLLFPFTLFEATLLGLLFSATGIYLLSTIFKTFGPGENIGLASMNNSSRWGPIEPREYKQLPTSRFYNTPDERTWEAWLRSEIANDVYREFQDAPSATSSMNEAQVQALAIRLADIMLSALKQKTHRAKRLNFTLATLKSAMRRQGQRAYDDDILRLALNAINLNMNFFEVELLEVIRTQGWKQLAERVEDEE